MKLRSTAIVVAVAGVLLTGVIAVRRATRDVAAYQEFDGSSLAPPSDEDATTRAHRLCSSCGLPDPEIDPLIERTRSAAETREARRFWLQAKLEGDDRLRMGFCVGCMDAVLDAAENGSG